MIEKHKSIFSILCFIVFLVNGYLTTVFNQTKSIEEFIGGGIGTSILSIPIWSCLGVVLSNIGLFFYKMIHPNDEEVLNIWQKASLGLLFAIVFKPLFGIIW